MEKKECIRISNIQITVERQDWYRMGVLCSENSRRTRLIRYDRTNLRRIAEKIKDNTVRTNSPVR